MSGETTRNYPEGYEEKPWCPHTKLIQICASLAGVEFTPETFCYEAAKNVVRSEGAIHWLEHADYYPKASCATVNFKLSEQLILAERELTLTPDEIINQELTEAQTYDDKKTVVGKYNQERALYSQKMGILNRWKKVIFETCCSTPEDEKNDHFRQIASAGELPESEVIDRVKSFTENLAAIVGYQKNQIGWFLGEVKYCPQAPTSWHFRRP